MAAKGKAKVQNHGQELERMQDPIDDQELESLYAWVDSIPLSRPKRHIGRDFSDGVLIAQLMHHFLPQTVDMHNYTAANCTKGKLKNWETLNRKVFAKLNFELAEDIIDDLVKGTSGTIEKVLLMLQMKIRNAEYHRGKQSDKPEADQHQMTSRKDSRMTKVSVQDTKGKAFAKTKQKITQSRLDLHAPVKLYKIDEYGYLIDRHYLDNRGWNSGSPEKKSPVKQPVRTDVIPKRRPGPLLEPEYVPRYVVEEKEQEILTRDETIQILQAKVSRLEHLLHLKDMRIDDLQGRIESTRPTGIKK